MSYTPHPADDALDDRTRRARTEQMAVVALGGGIYAVDSESGATYTVDLPGGRCTCPDHRYRGGWCKHLRRVDGEVAAGTVPPPGFAPVECAVCGRRFHAAEPAESPHYCERCDRDPGEFVVDRETGDLLVVASGPAGRADETPVPGHDVTVADYPGNEGYLDDDPVVEVLYPLTSGTTGEDVAPGDLQRYRFPASRLRDSGDAERE
ncbi:MAG: SWIM zinc finger family protein [Halobacteriales archaeon]